MAEPVRLHLFGPVEITRGTKPVRGFESRKAVALLGYLVLRGLPLARTHLADLFWREKPEPQARVQVLFGAGAGAWLQGEYGKARELGDRRTLAYALTTLGLLRMHQGEPEAAGELHRESEALFRELGDRWGLAVALTDLELVAPAPAAGEQAIAIFRELHDDWGVALALNIAARAAFYQKDYAAVQARMEEALALRCRVGDQYLVAQSLSFIGEAARRQGNAAAAEARFRESLELNRELGNRHGLIECLAEFAALAAGRGDAARATRLFGAAEALRESIGEARPAAETAEWEGEMATLRAQLAPAEWEAA